MLKSVLEFTGEMKMTFSFTSEVEEKNLLNFAEKQKSLSTENRDSGPAWRKKLNSVILMGPFQLGIFCDSMIL